MPANEAGGMRCWKSSTSATTLALATVGAPMVTLPSLLTSRTRSKVMGLPASAATLSSSDPEPQVGS